MLLLTQRSGHRDASAGVPLGCTVLKVNQQDVERMDAVAVRQLVAAAPLPLVLAVRMPRRPSRLRPLPAVGSV